MPEWRLFWTERAAWVPSGFDPLLDQWADIDERERAVGIERRTPILIDPAGRLDPWLARYFRRSRFAFCAEETRESYAVDYRLFFTFLWSRGRYWDQADHEDVEDFEAWRRRGEDNPARIGGAKWARELAAFKMLYDWAVACGRVAASPVRTHVVRSRGGASVQVADQRPKDVRYSNVKWLTPRTYRWWRDVGLRGYGADGLPDPGFRGRNAGRNAAFADLLFDSGLRLREGGCLLTLEVPDALFGQSFYEGTVAAGIAKRRERMFYVSAGALSGVTAYLAVARRAAVRRAQRAGRYEVLPAARVATGITGGARPAVTWVDGAGLQGRSAIGLLSPWERQRLLVEGESGLEPLWLWLGESGLPLEYESWEKVFDAANERCARFGKPIEAAPHVLRHSFALKMLVTLQRALDARFGLDEAERRLVRDVYGGAFCLVKDLLGHASEQTTRDIYLEPVTGLRLRLILDGSEDLDAVLARVAASSRRVMDLDPDEPS